ncbi:MAG: Uma2 family endonuclease [Pseudomonadota bacterium]
MHEPAPKRMTVDEFLTWAMTQPGRYELVDGEVVAISPERVGHGVVKAAVWLALKRGIEAAGLTCEALPDGMTVRIDERTTYEPDALVRCGKPLDRAAVEIPDPLVIVEVLSPSTQAVDLGGKLEGYFRVASVRHYLIVKLATRSVIHFRRADDGTLRTSILAETAALTLDPPGLEVPVASFFDGL